VKPGAEDKKGGGEDLSSRMDHKRWMVMGKPPMGKILYIKLVMCLIRCFTTHS
jgi:hypothetical protein